MERKAVSAIASTPLSKSKTVTAIKPPLKLVSMGISGMMFVIFSLYLIVTYCYFVLLIFLFNILWALSHASIIPLNH
jgi:hypothetical protein